MNTEFACSEAHSLRAGRGSIALLPVVLSFACYLPGFTEVEGPNVRYVSVATGDLHTCGLTEVGEIYCWSSADRRPKALPTPMM